MQRNWKILGLFVLLVVFAAQAAAQAAAPAGAQPPNAAVTLAGKIIVLAGTVAALLQGVKKLVPAIKGPWAIALSVAAALAGAYAAAPAGQVFNVDFFTTAVGTALGANGIHSFLRQPTGA